LFLITYFCLVSLNYGERPVTWNYRPDIFMASRDYLIRQIEEMGLFLSILFRRLLKMKEEKQQDQMGAVVREALMQEMKLDIDQVVVLENEDFLSVVREHFTSENQLDQLADILKELGQDINQTFSPTKEAYLRKSLLLFSWLQESTTNFSYERKVKIEQILECLRICGLLE